MRYCLLLLCLLVLHSAHSQHIAIGAGLTFGYSIPEKMEIKAISPNGKLGVGLNSSVRYRINDIYSFYTGLNIVRKASTIKHNEFDFPNLSYTGSLKVGMSNTFIQIPLLFSRSLQVSDKGFFEILAGINASRMKPTKLVVKNTWSPQYSGTDKFEYIITGDSIDFKTRYGLELNFGLAYNLKVNAESDKTHRIVLGLEKTFFTGPSINYEVQLSNDTQIKKYIISEKPKLWCFKVEYTYYFCSR
ncbi:MAG TPA: hypothetical protein DIW47_11535 [Bacteroidetes bacterium]|nr:hypothetical protein [Bacteroidota bacterium]